MTTSQQLALLLLASCGHSTGGRSAVDKPSAATPLWDRARPDAQPAPRSNALFNYRRSHASSADPLRISHQMAAFFVSTFSLKTGAF